MAQYPQTITLDEATARRVLLARAIEDADTRGRLLAPEERDRVEQAVRQALADPSQPAKPEPARYLALRADRLLAAVVAHHPRFAGLDDPARWHGHLAWLLPALAFISGAASERIGDPHKLDLLSPPLVMLMAWNVAVYVLLALSLIPRASRRPSLPSRVAGWLGALPFRLHEMIGMGLRAPVIARFRQLWWGTAGTLEAQRLQQVLHGSAAAWAIGVAVSIAAGGIVREYRVGWESLWLDAGGVHSLLNLAFAPVLWLLPVQGFTLEELQQLHSNWGVPVGREQAQKWVALYLGLLALVVIIPRTLLAAVAGWRRRRLARAVDVALGDPYFAEVLARMNPTITVGYVATPTSMGELVLTVLRQAAREPALALRGTGESSLVRMPGGDELRAVPAAAAADIDQVWLSVAGPEELRAAVPVLQATGKPVLILHPRAVSGRDLNTIASEAGLVADVLDIEGVASAWAFEQRLWDRLLERLHPSRQPRGMRLVQEVRRVQEARMRQSMRVVGEVLARSARERQKLPAEAWPRLPTTESRERGRSAREAAMTDVLLNVDRHVAGALRQLRDLHGLAPATLSGGDGLVAAPASAAAAELLHPPNAAVAGAAAGMAAGALAGAKIDLLTGGLTMGAGAAVGALIGGTGAFGAARWFGGDSDIRLSDDQLGTLTRRMIVHYLSVIHACRVPADAAQTAPERWKTEAQAGLDADVKVYERLWPQTRKLPGEADAILEAARAVETTVLEVLDRLRPPAA